MYIRGWMWKETPRKNNNEEYGLFFWPALACANEDLCANSLQIEFPIVGQVEIKKKKKIPGIIFRLNWNLFGLFLFGSIIKHHNSFIFSSYSILQQINLDKVCNKRRQWHGNSYTNIDNKEQQIQIAYRLFENIPNPLAIFHRNSVGRWKCSLCQNQLCNIKINRHTECREHTKTIIALSFVYTCAGCVCVLCTFIIRW